MKGWLGCRRLVPLLCLGSAMAFGVAAEGAGDGVVQKGGNLLFLERFNNGLSAWQVAATGGTVEIVEKDFSNKLQLSGSNESGVAATRSFAEPPRKWILEYDEKIGADDEVCVMELLGDRNQVIAVVAHGAKPGGVSFGTDRDGPATASWAVNKYKQVIVVVDRANGTVACQISEDDHTYGSLQSIGGAKRYSGSPVAAVRFRTGSAVATAYIDEVKIFTPNTFIIGDSISDGKPLWSTHPEYPPRLTKAHDETSSPSYQLSRKFENEWVANRGFGGSSLGGVDARIQTVPIAQGAQKVIIHVGHNDIYPGRASLAVLQKVMDSIIDKMEKAGITGRNIILCSVSPSAMINTPEEQDLRGSYNKWLPERAKEIGATFADVAAAVRDDAAPNKLKRDYDVGDGVHFNKAGSGVIADTIFKALTGKE